MKILLRFLMATLAVKMFSIDCATLNELENEFKGLTSRFQILNAELDRLATIKPVKIELFPSQIKVQTSFDVKESEKKGTNLIDRLAEETKKQLKPIWDSFTWENFKKKFKEEYEGPYKGTKASVQKGVRLTQKGAIDPATSEGKFLARRMDVALKAVQKFTDLKFNDKSEMPKIGCAFSGGGYRAMILTSGYLKALEDLGLLEGILYISTLSGSTWYLGPWTFQQDPSENKKTTVAAFNQMVVDKIQKIHFNLLDPKHAKDFNSPLFASDIIWPKVLFDQVISSVDIYGAALAHYLLADLGDQRQLQRLSDQIKNVELGNHPWPIYTSVSMYKSDDKKKPYLYNWYEFNPSEIRNLENDCAIPSFAFGRKFENGQSIDFSPGQSFGFLMGIFGSAYTINLQDVIRILFGGLAKTDSEQEKLLADLYKEPLSWAKSSLTKMKKIFVMAANFEFKNIWEMVKQDFDQVKGALLVRFLGFVADISINVADKTIKIGGKDIKVGSARFVPAQVFNPFKGYTSIAQKWLQEKELLTFLDAGIDYNIPLRSMLRPERDLDVVIVGDASGDVPDGTIQLDLALADIKRFYGLDYKKDEQKSDATMMIYRPQQETYPKVDERLKGVRPPIIIYFNFLKDEKVFQEAVKNPELQKLVTDNNVSAFDAKKCLSEGFCSTFNFAYSIDDYKQLSAVGEFNIRAHEESLKDIIEERAELRVEHPEFGG